MIESRDASYVYPGSGEPAVRAVSLHVAAGEIVGIVGPNGSGKSTMGRLIKGLMVPSSGHILVDDVDSRLDPLAIRRAVGLVFQSPDNQIVNSTVITEVAFGPENLGLPSAEIGRRVEDALAAVSLQGHEQDEVHTVSMAQKQRVALASVIAMQPTYLVLDEPTAWIEPRDRWPLLQMVIAWARARGAGVVLITHRMEEAQLCSRVYGMLDGAVLAQGAPSNVLNDRGTRDRLALELPETFELMRQLHEAGVTVEFGPGGVDAMAEALWPS